MITKTQYISNGNVKTQQGYVDLFEEVNRVLDKINTASSNTIIDDDPDGTGIKYTINSDLKTALSNIATGDQQNFLVDEGVMDDNGNFTINTIDEYFSFLTILGEIHPKFIRLPLDEAPFVINLNKRTITNPSGNNVYAVEADNHAETIYFKCDRYYETVDLGDSDIINIVIQAQYKVNGVETNTLFKAQTVDVDSEPGYIIFGWIIPEEVTQNDGTVKFAVRFYNLTETTDNEFILNYSLNTLPTSIQVLKSLSFDINDLKSGIVPTKPYLENYAIRGTQNITVPQFTLNGDNINRALNADEDECAEFSINMISEHGANELKYNWYRIDPLDIDEDTNSFSKSAYNIVYIYAPVIVEAEEENLEAAKQDDFNTNWRNYFIETNGIYTHAVQGSFDLNTTYYTRTINNSATTTINPNQYGFYGCKVTAEINRFKKETDTPSNDYKFIAWPAEIEFADDVYTSYIGEYDDNDNLVLTNNDIEYLQDNLLEVENDYNDYTIFDSNNVTIEYNNTYGKIIASHDYNESEEVTTELNNVTLLKPCKELTSETGAEKFTITTVGDKKYFSFSYADNTNTTGIWYNNDSHGFTAGYADCLSAEIIISNGTTDIDLSGIDDIFDCLNEITFDTHTTYDVEINIYYHDSENPIITCSQERISLTS